MNKTKRKVPNRKTLREELAATIIGQARTDSKILDDIASNIADVIDDDNDENNDQSLTSQILGMKIQDKEFRQRLIQKVLEEYGD